MSHTVVAELVAAVMKVEVEVGQKVAADDPVVILESMKMEIRCLPTLLARCRRSWFPPATWSMMAIPWW